MHELDDEGYGPETRARQEASIRRAKGPTILLGSGTYFDYVDPDNSPITIEDVAYGLGFESRFAGQCLSRVTGRRAFYSVAEHCIRMSRLIPEEHRYAALMHEVGEAVCGDATSPLKSLCPDYKVVEKRCEKALLARFGVDIRDKTLIKEYDLIMLAWERRDLTPWDGSEWTMEPMLPPPDEPLVPMGPYEAAEAFLSRFRELAPAEILKAQGFV